MPASTQEYKDNSITAGMADISLYLTNVNVSIGQNKNMDLEQTSNLPKDFQCVDLGEEVEMREGVRGTQQQQQREKAPRRIIHFSSGETMEEYSTDEEEEGEDREAERKDLLSPPVDAVRSQMTWGPYVWFHMWKAATNTISACDYLGERMASLFGITSAKYQYAIDEYYRMKKEKEEDNRDNQLSEEAERYFNNQLQSLDQDQDEPITVQDLSDASAPHTDVAYQIENENHLLPPATIRVPAIVTAT